MKWILVLMVIANVLFTSSLSTIKRRQERRHSIKEADFEVLHKLGDITRLPLFHKSTYKRKFDKLQDIPECKTDQCTQQSLNMSRMMNKSTDPCENFYHYACGGWIAEGLPGDHAKWTIFSYLAEQTESKLRYLIEEQKDAANGSVAKLVYNWYASCKDQQERDKLGATPLLDLLHTIFGEEFNPFAPNSFSDWVLEDILATVHRGLGVFPLFTVSLNVDPRNSSSPTLLAISQMEPLIKSHNLQLTTEEHTNRIAQAYLVLMSTLTELLGGFQYQDGLSLRDEILGILVLEMNIGKIMQEVSNEPELEITKWTIQDFQAEVPGFDWERYFSKLTEGLGNQSFSNSEEVFVESPKFLKELIMLLNLETVSNRKGIIANYITWFVVYSYAPYLSSDFHDAYLAFARVAYGIQKSSPLWRRCVRGTDESLDMGVSALFINGSGFTNESILHASNMVRDIRAAFIDNLKAVTWMDNATKEAAKDKAEAILQQIGYPQFIMNETLLEQYFEGFNVDPQRFFQNRLTEMGLRIKNTLLFRGRPQSRFEWDMRPTEINAYYSPTSNKIVVPAGILRPPFYHVEYPHAENFGALGFVVGHELTHGFDVTGAMFDKEGNLANWWSKTSFENFQAREKCLVDQYSADCEVQGHKLDGKKTLGENTADNGGLKLAYKAYKKWLASKDHDTVLPDLGLTSDQLFFLSFAQIWCEKETPSYALTDLTTNVHSPGKFRVEETLQNNADFAKAFNCKLGSPMNPKHKCQVW